MNHQRLNKEGYPDPTPYEAFKAMEDEEMRELRAFRPIVYICSRYAGDVASHVRLAQRYSRFAVDMGFIPLTVHLLYPQFMCDDDPRERSLALQFGNVLMGKCSQVWVFTGQGVSGGMAGEIARAKRKGYRLRYFDADCMEVVR